MIRFRKDLVILVLLLAAGIMVVPVLADSAGTNETTEGTTEVHLVKYANDDTTILNETTVDYHWMEDNLPIYGDGVTRYYHQGPVFDGVWEDEHPDEPYDGWNPDEDIKISILYKGDFGAVKGTNIKDLCDYIGGASDGDRIDVCARDGWTRAYTYSMIYEPDPRQGPAVLCWYSGNGSGPDMQEGKEQGEGYPDTGYIAGMRMIFFADTSTNPWGWHVFGNNDMKECWPEEDWNYGGQYPSAAGTSPMWVDEIRIYSQESAPKPPVANFTVIPTSGTVPLAVTFTDTSTGNPSSWSWDFGDGTNSTDPNTTHTYTAVGTYTVNLTVTNAAGSSSIAMTITTTSSSSGGDGDDSGDSGDSGDSDTVTAVNTTVPSVNTTETSSTVAIQSRTFSFNGSGIDEITVSGLFDPASLNISCEKVTAPTGTTPEAPGKVYAYYTITCDSENATLDEGRIRFSIPEAWIDGNNLENSSFVLYRYNLSWDPLVTTRVGTGNGSRIYEATTPGFSLFAISSERTTYTHIVTIPPMKENISSKQTTQAPPEEEEPTGNSPMLLWVGIAAVALVAAAGIAYWYLSLRKKTDETEEN